MSFLHFLNKTKELFWNHMLLYFICFLIFVIIVVLSKICITLIESEKDKPLENFKIKKRRRHNLQSYFIRRDCNFKTLSFSYTCFFNYYCACFIPLKTLILSRRLEIYIKKTPDANPMGTCAFIQIIFKKNKK